MTRNAWMGFGILLLALPALAQTPVPVAPQVEVTFYSSGSFMKAAIPGYKYGDFAGKIFDERNQLAMLRPGHFITFKLDAGPHIFSASSWADSEPDLGGHLKIDLVANQHYYIGTYMKTPLLVLSTFRLEQRTCQEAQKDNARTKPLAPKHLKKYGAAHTVIEAAFPLCPD